MKLVLYILFGGVGSAIGYAVSKSPLGAIAGMIVGVILGLTIAPLRTPSKKPKASYSKVAYSETPPKAGFLSKLFGFFKWLFIIMFLLGFIGMLVK